MKFGKRLVIIRELNRLGQGRAGTSNLVFSQVSITGITLQFLAVVCSDVVILNGIHYLIYCRDLHEGLIPKTSPM